MEGSEPLAIDPTAPAVRVAALDMFVDLLSRVEDDPSSDAFYSGLCEATCRVASVKRDWAYLVDTLRITGSPRYLRHRGRPVLAVWGFGFRDRSPARTASR